MKRRTTYYLDGVSATLLEELVENEPAPPPGTDKRFKPSRSALVQRLIAIAHADMRQRKAER